MAYGMLTVFLVSFVLDFGHCVNTVYNSLYFTNYSMFSFALICASTRSTTIDRLIVFVTVIGDSFAGFASKGDGFDLCTSARECVETFAATGDCLELLASKGD